ncbi:MAG: hypothetical protein JWM34_3275 [Ilumatobacteraceae bacterium]|nr:hypothetical protein [Ilumatobacteraceae bacterium]
MAMSSMRPTTEHPCAASRTPERPILGIVDSRHPEACFALHLWIQYCLLCIPYVV